jgi:hypothetical protein
VKVVECKRHGEKTRLACGVSPTAEIIANAFQFMLTPEAVHRKDTDVSRLEDLPAVG